MVVGKVNVTEGQGIIETGCGLNKGWSTAQLEENERMLSNLKLMTRELSEEAPTSGGECATMGTSQVHAHVRHSVPSGTSLFSGVCDWANPGRRFSAFFDSFTALAPPG